MQHFFIPSPKARGSTMSQPPPAPAPVSRGRPAPAAPVATVAPTRSLVPGTKLLLGNGVYLGVFLLEIRCTSVIKVLLGGYNIYHPILEVL